MGCSVRSVLHGLLVLGLFLLPCTACLALEVTSPEAHFGFKPGADRELIDYEQLIEYIELLDAASPRLELREVGRSPLDRPIYVAFISTAGNISNLDALQEINRQLALDPEIGDSRRETLIENGRVFVMMTLSMHSNEVGPSQAMPIFAHDLVSTQDSRILGQLEEVVFMMVPCHNPDGMDMEVEYYRKQKGTKYEGSSLPGVYHRYVGHDNNRDFVTLTQTDTQAINRVYSVEWFPQVLNEKHQMMSTGPRYFVPPYHDPITINIDQGLWRWSSVFGANMARDMGREGLTGVAQHWLFDFYWPGSTETALWKNVISFLTEAAGCKRAKPVFVEHNELTVRGKGLSEYKKSTNMPDPWPGGWWRLDDIVRYEISSMYSILETAATYREEILRFRNDSCRAEVERGRSEPPAYFVMPAKQHDRSELLHLVALLGEHGVEVARTTKRIDLEGRVLMPGDLVVPLSQPYRPFIKEVMEAQRYPVRRYTPQGEIISPYDVTSWSLPLHRGVATFEISAHTDELDNCLEPVEINDLVSTTALPDRFWALAYPATDNAAFMAAFKALGLGFDVSRITAEIESDEQTLPAGSFLIHNDPDKSADLENLSAEIQTRPIVLAQEIDVDRSSLSSRRIALVETWMHDMDAGWTRYVFDTYGIPFEVVRPGDFATTDFVDRFDVVIFPDAEKGVILEGKPSKDGKYFRRVDYPPEHMKGLGDEGMEKLMAFLDQGGLIVSWRRSVPLFLDGLEIKRGEDDIESFELPVSDISEKAGESGLKVPGSFLRINVLEGHPLTYGMPQQTGIFSRGTPVLQTSIPILDMDRRVVARFPEEEILLSGYAEAEECLADKPAMVWVRKGKGQLVLMSFNPQFRASTPATYKLLFNALLLPEAE